MPTDTIYGLVAKASDKEAVSRLYELKSRQAKPGTLIAASIDQLTSLGLKRRYLKAVEQFWPGPLSVIIPKSDSKLDYLTQGLPDIAVRIPYDEFVTGVLSRSGPLITTSANLPGQPESETIDQARRYFSDKVDAYIDGGNLKGRQPSTIIRVIDDAIEIIRQGAMDVPKS